MLDYPPKMAEERIPQEPRKRGEGRDRVGGINFPLLDPPQGQTLWLLLPPGGHTFFLIFSKNYMNSNGIPGQNMHMGRIDRLDLRI